MQGGAEQLVDQHVASRSIRRVAARDSLFLLDMARHAELSRPVEGASIVLCSSETDRADHPAGGSLQ